MVAYGVRLKSPGRKHASWRSSQNTHFMILKTFISRCSVPMLALTLTASLQAKTVPVSPPANPGHARPPLHINLTPSVSASYSPSQIRHAYGFDQVSSTGANQKIAIVDAYGNAQIQTDLNTFCSQYGLSPMTVQVLGNNAGTDTGWALETALDVEWAHAIAPNATIILSVAASTSSTDLLKAVDAAVNAGATAVSMSWGGPEFSGMGNYDNHFNKPGVTFTASSGDNGAGVEWPAASPYVLSVGGTTLYLDVNGNRTSESAWSGSGGGTSGYYSEPSYQTGWQTSNSRGVPDVSLVADPNTGVLVYDAVNGGWYVVGGTSASAPMWAGLVSLANELRVNSGTALLGQINSALYPLAKGNSTAPYTINSAYFYDVSQGNNGGYTAGPTYDFVTGLGVPVANALIPALAPAVQMADFTVAASPGSQTSTVGGTAGYTVTTTAVGAFSSAIGLTVSGLPTGATATFSPQSITGAGSSTLAVATSATTPAGTYTLTVTGSSGSLVHAATVTLVVQSQSSADFAIGVTPGSANIKGGNSVSYQITISANGGFSDNVNLSVSGLPTGATASFSANSVTGSGTSIVTVTTSRSTPKGSYQLTVTGTSSTGTLRHSANANLRIR
jgi:subtilase family serine protease